MAKPIYAGTYPSRGRGRWRRVFVIILLLQIVAVGIFFYLKKDKNETPQEKAATTDRTEQVDTISPDTPIKPAEVLTPQIATSTPESRRTVESARAKMADGDLLAAKSLLDYQVANTPDPEAIQLLGEINMKLLMASPMQVPGMQRYTIQSGDSLDRIAKHFGTTVALIQKTNRIENASRIKINQSIFVLTGSFSIRVSKTQNYLDLLLDGKLFKRYAVGTGKMGKTPAVEFYIYDKITNPTWTRLSDGKKIEFGDPENVLGTRWMALKSDEHAELTGFGIHGTWEDNSIGKQSSAGCVRMHNKDVEELFDMVPRKTAVTISE